MPDTESYPYLLKKIDNPHFQREFHLTSDPLEEELVTNVYFVPKMTNGWLFIVKEDGRMDFPGGTIEEGETIQQALERELMEEAGIQIESQVKLGHWTLHSKYPAPLRPYFPHPDSGAVVFTGEAKQVSAPTNPKGSVPTIKVKTESIQFVLSQLKETERHLQHDIYLASSELLNHGL